MPLTRLSQVATNDPVQQKLEDLYDLCQKFVDKNHITQSRADALSRSFTQDRFVAEIAAVVGYA